MFRILLALDADFLFQSTLDSLLEFGDVESLIRLMEFLKLSPPRFDIFVDSQEGWDLLIVDMHEILVWQVSQQDMCPLSSVFRKPIKNGLLLFVLVFDITFLLAVHLGILIAELVVNKLIEAIVLSIPIWSISITLFAIIEVSVYRRRVKK